MQIENFLEIKIAYKPKLSKRELPKITCSGDAAAILRNLYDADTIEYVEQFIVLFINRANKPIGWKCVSMGGLDATIVDLRVIFQCALLMNAHGIILSHNHPSGNLQPSQADYDMTKKIVKAGEIMGIKVLDHVIMSESEYRSFADHGEL